MRQPRKAHRQPQALSGRYQCRTSTAEAFPAALDFGLGPGDRTASRLCGAGLCPSADRGSRHLARRPGARDRHGNDLRRVWMRPTCRPGWTPTRRRLRPRLAEQQAGSRTPICRRTHRPRRRTRPDRDRKRVEEAKGGGDRRTPRCRLRRFDRVGRGGGDRDADQPGRAGKRRAPSRRQLGSGESAQRVRATWQKELVAHLDKHKRYPSHRLARRPPEITVAFQLDRLGHVLSTRDRQGSGDLAFDEAALAMVRTLRPGAATAAADRR